VDEVLVVAPVVSQEAKTEAESLRKDLLAVYEKRNILGAKEEQAKAVIAKYPYFHLISFEKSYPNRLVVRVEEGEEVFAVTTGESDSYFILDKDGVVLSVRDNPNNRADGAANVLVSGSPALRVFGEKGKKLQGDVALDKLFEFCLVYSERLGGLRTNLESVEVFALVSSETETIFRLKMREGVTVYAKNPFSSLVEKAEKTLEEYLSLSDNDRLTGAIIAFDGVDGVSCDYYERDQISPTEP
jgi:hypothetical protein